MNSFQFPLTFLVHLPMNVVMLPAGNEVRLLCGLLFIIEHLFYFDIKFKPFHAIFYLNANAFKRAWYEWMTCVLYV